MLIIIHNHKDLFTFFKFLLFISYVFYNFAAYFLTKIQI